MKIFIFLSCLLFLSCANIKQMNDPQKKELLAYTKKFEQDDFLVIASYINPIYPRDNDEFIVSIYPQTSQILTNTISINQNSDDIKVEILSDDDEILNKLSFKISWSKHYKISTKAKLSDILHLTFIAICENTLQYQVVLNFQKIAKSLYWNPR